MSDRKAAAQQLFKSLQNRSQKQTGGIKSSPLLYPLRLALHHFRRYKSLRRLQNFQKHIQSANAKSIIRSLPGIDGEFEIPVTNNTMARLLGGSYEPLIIEMFRTILKPGDHVVDVGANMGFYSVLASQLVTTTGRVLAVEPIPTMLKILNANIARNHCTNTEVFSGAISNQSGEITINYVVGAEEYSSLGTISHPDAVQRRVEAIPVKTETLDEIVSRFELSPRLLKVDTEGAEGLVFEGATKTLEQHRPIVISELDSRLLKTLNSSVEKVTQILSARNYRIFCEENGSEITKNVDPAYVGDIVALPAELLQ